MIQTQSQTFQLCKKERNSYWHLKLPKSVPDYVRTAVITTTKKKEEKKKLVGQGIFHP